jgi:hypothetical protein
MSSLYAPVGTVRGCRQLVAGDRRDRPRREVEDHHVGGGQIGQGLDGDARFDLRVQFAEALGHRIRNGARTAFCDGPAVAVTGGDDHQPDRRGGRARQRIVDVGGNPAKECAGLLAAPHAGQHGRGQQRSAPEAGECDGMLGDVNDRPEQVVSQLIETPRQRREQPPPGPGVVAVELLGGGIDGRVKRRGTSVVQGVRHVDIGVSPTEPIVFQLLGLDERGGRGHHVNRRAVVVQQTRESELAGPGAASDPGVSL